MHNWASSDWTTFFSSLGVLVGLIVAGVLKVLASIKEIKVSIDGRMDELLAVSRKANLAEGRDQQRADTEAAADKVKK